MKKFFLALLIFVLTTKEAYSVTSPKGEMMEEILFQHYSSDLLKITNRLYDCRKILSIKRMDSGHLIKVGLITFTGPHNPPNDLYIITFKDSPIGQDQPFQFHLENVDITKNISNDQYEAFCRQ